MADNTIEFDIVARLDGVEKALKGIEKQGKETGDKLNDNLGSGLGTSLKKSFVAVTAVIGTAVAGFALLRSSIRDAVEEQNAVQKLNQSLASAGTFSKEASLGIQAFADQIERTTTLSAPTVMNLTALSRNFARSNEEAQKLTQAAIELSAATGINLESAVEGLGKTLSGQAGRLAQQVPALRGLSAEALKTGAALDAVISRFGGSAEAKVNTFQGAMIQLENSFGKFREGIGRLFTQSPVLVALFKEISRQIRVFVGEVDRLVGDKDPIGFLIKKLLDLASVLNNTVIGTIATSGRTLLAWSKVFIVSTELIANGLASVTGGAKFSDSFDKFNEKLAEINKELYTPTTQNTIGNVIDDLKVAIDNATPIIDDFKNNQAPKIAEAIDPLTNPELGISFKNLEEAFKRTASKIKLTAIDLATQLNQSFVGGFSNAFAAFGGALAKGENAFAAFGKSILASLGQLLIQFGTTLVAIGLGLSTVPFLFGLQGTAAVAAGTAAIILGGALSALGGGGGAGGGAQTSAGGGVAGGGFQSPVGDSATSLAETTPIEPGTQVAVNINGNVLGDKRTLGIAVAEAINEAFGSDGAVIARGALA